MYQKEIIYMSLFVDDIKERCVGYLKWEYKQGKYQLELQVKNMPGRAEGSFPIRIQSETGWQETGMLTIKDGGGKWRGTLAEAMLKAEILISNSCKIKGQSRNQSRDTQDRKAQDRSENVQSKVARSENVQSKVAQSENIQGMSAQDGDAQNKAAQSENVQSKVAWSENMQSISAQDGDVQNKVARSENVQSISAQDGDVQYMTKVERQMEEQMGQGIYGEITGQAESQTRKQIAGQSEPQITEPTLHAESMAMPQRRPSKPKPMARAEQAATEQIMAKRQHTPLYENKWEQLLNTYERIHPYGDNRVYVKLEPKDFIVLRENYQHLVNNSFLLHGFYNYRYLILGREKDFYLGVPGVFYEREKMVALMFGFEVFECEGGEAEEGKFGYYLRKVEI